MAWFAGPPYPEDGGAPAWGMQKRGRGRGGAPDLDMELETLCLLLLPPFLNICNTEAGAGWRRDSDLAPPCPGGWQGMSLPVQLRPRLVLVRSRASNGAARGHLAPTAFQQPQQLFLMRQAGPGTQGQALGPSHGPPWLQG